MINNVSKPQEDSYIRCFSFLRERIKHRLRTEYNLAKDPVPELDTLNLTDDSHLSAFIKREHLSDEDTILLLLALVTHLAPGFLSDIISDVFPNGGEFPEFGGVKGKQHRGILPTGETALFVLFGSHYQQRLRGMNLIYGDSILFRKNMLCLGAVPKGEPPMSGKLLIDEEYLARLTTGKVLKPKLSEDFPASIIETGLEWSDLILNPKTLAEIKEIEVWLQYNQILMRDWGMKAKIKPGFRVMFHGLPGTGKTLTASLLGKYTGRDVYRVDLSMVVSKYIGETEKSLSRLFDKAADKDWILFFDEADSVFGKRTNVRDAHDKYANQEVSYLLQRIEAHSGLVILASNFKSNIDTAFTRRFQSLVEFDMPSYNERLQLWKNNLPEVIALDSDVNLEDIARKYAVSGASIVNIIHYTCLKTLASNQSLIKRADLMEGIKKEYQKEGKTLNV
ncbi:ATP-binding protein [Seonamhaeicola sp.]|uniref:ATP-binding protein n=1 Tax=Seonamhaeicola sp. TaxID=1912245 RepID=UPI002601F65C|nr:ATP-binding protein [Seonamhaeicola sp.]